VRTTASTPKEPVLTPSFVTLWMVGFWSYAGTYLSLGALPLYLQYHGLSPVAVGAVLAAMSVAAFLVRPLGGWAADRVGPQHVVLGGAACLVLGNVGLATISSAVGLAAARAISGLGWGCVSSNANTIAGSLAQHRRGEVIALYTVAGSVALAAAPGVGLLLANRYSYGVLFWIASGASALAVAFSAFLPRAGAAPLPRPLRLRSLLDRDVAFPSAMLAAHSMSYGAVLYFLPLVTRGNATTLGSFFTIYALALVALRTPAGRLSDRFGRLLSVLPGLFASAGAMLLVALAAAGSPWAVWPAAVALALATAFVQPATLAWSVDLARDRLGAAMATTVMAQDLGIASGGFLLGLVASRAGLTTAFAVIAAVPATAMVVGFARMQLGRLPGASSNRD
jgi:MFS family permease